MVTATSGPADRVREVVQPVVEAAGLHLEDVTVSKAGRRSVVRVVVDLDEDAVGSLDLDALGEVSREVSAAMDAADPVRGEHVLEVSTPGTDRPLTEPRHFRRARTRLVRLVLRDGSTVRGRLIEVVAGAGAETLEVETEPGQTLRVGLSEVVDGEIEVELRRLDAADGDGAQDAPVEGDDEEGLA